MSKVTDVEVSAFSESFLFFIESQKNCGSRSTTHTHTHKKYGTDFILGSKVQPNRAMYDPSNDDIDQNSRSQVRSNF